MSVQSLDEGGSILALVPNWLGDVAMCTPALRSLKRRFPKASLTVAGRASACALLDGLSWIDSLAPISKDGGVFAVRKAARSLRSASEDLSVVFPHSFRAALFASFAGSRTRLGYARNSRSWLLTDAPAPHRVNGRVRPIYMGAEYLELVAHIGCEDDGEGMELHATEEAIAAVRAKFAQEKPLVGLAPGAAFGPSKCWPAARYAEVNDILVEQAGAQCVLLTGPGEEETRSAVIRAATHEPIVCDGGNPTIDSLKAVVSQLDVLICNDSGPRHVAVAFGVPTVCIMGPTSPVYSEGPYERGRVLRVDVECGPCQKPVCTTDHACMTRIEAGEVAEAAVEHMRARRRTP